MPRRSRSRASRAARRSRRPCRRAPSWSRPARSPTPCWRARMRRTPSSTASISARIDEDGKPVTPERRRQAGRGARADASPRRRPLHVVLRRPASVLRRQRREGDGRRQAGLSGADARDGRRCRRPSARPPRSWPRPTASGAPRVRAGRSPDADHRRGRGRGAGGGEATSSPASSTACRTTRRGRRRSTARCSPWRAWR